MRTISSTLGTHMWAANQDDEEIAELILQLNKGKIDKGGPPPLVGWTADRADMAALIDWTAANALSGSDKFKPVPRPVTAIERVKQRVVDVKKNSVEAKLTGKRS